MSARPYRIIAWKVRLPGFSEGHLGSRPLLTRSYASAAARDRALAKLKKDGVQYLGSTLRWPTGLRVEGYDHGLES